MPQTATIEIKTTAGKEVLSDKQELEIGGYAAVSEAAVCAHTPTPEVVDLYAGPVGKLETVVVKSDIYKPAKCGPHEYNPIRIKFNDGSWFDLEGPLFLSGEALYRFFNLLASSTVTDGKAADAAGAVDPKPDPGESLNTLTVDNRMPQDVKISVLVIRKKADAKENGNCGPSGCN